MGIGRQASFSNSNAGMNEKTGTNSSASETLENGHGYGYGHGYVPPPPHHIPDPRDPSKPTFFARAMRSEAVDESKTVGAGNGKAKEYLGLPFRLTVYTAQEHVARNVPYLRHSWNRIDFIAIVAFWITFVLSEVGAERSHSRHIAVFRALSVLRTSRLLAVTNGTTVSGLGSLLFWISIALFGDLCRLI